MLAKAIAASLQDSHAAFQPKKDCQPPSFIISPIEKENIQLFAELMERLHSSKDACRDSDLDSLSMEMRGLFNKLKQAYESDPAVSFPGDIRRTIALLEEALLKYDSVPAIKNALPHPSTPQTVSIPTSPPENNPGYPPGNSQVSGNIAPPGVQTASYPPPTMMMPPHMQYSYPMASMPSYYPPYNHMLMPPIAFQPTPAPHTLTPPTSVSASKKDSTVDETPLIDL